MRSFGKLILICGAVALLGGDAMAQAQKKGGGRGFGGFGGGFGGGTNVLRAPNVQKDLKLSDEQVGKVDATLQSVREKNPLDFASLRDLSDEERGKKLAEHAKTTTEDVKKELALTADQSHRLDQIILQTQGLQAFASPHVQDKLKLTDDQKAKVKELSAALRERTQGLGLTKDSSADERRQAMTMMTGFRKESLEKVTAMLTGDQKKEWKELTGEAIEVQMPPRRQNNQ